MITSASVARFRLRRIAFLLGAALSASGCALVGSDSTRYLDSCPYWSSDSHWIAFGRAPAGVETVDRHSHTRLPVSADVYVTDADGRRLLRLTSMQAHTSAWDDAFGWLERPSRLVYRKRNGLYAIAPQTGAKPHRLTTLNPSDALVSLSYDGRSAFVLSGMRTAPGESFLGLNSGYEDVVVDLTRQTRHSVDRGPFPGDDDAAWSPDDTYLAYVHSDIEAQTEIVVARDEREVLRKPIHRNPFGGADGLAWSPDGRRLAYSATASDVDEDAQIFIWRLDDNTTRKLTQQPTANNTAPVWSHDGRLLYYLSDGTLRSITPAGKKDKRLADVVTCFASSPDGTRIAFTRTLQYGDVYHADSTSLMLMQADGSDQRPVTAGTNP
jgi:Tol biopolymer transport system component